MFPRSDPLEMYESLSVAFEQGPLPPPTILSEAGLSLKLWGARMEPRPPRMTSSVPGVTL